MTKERERELAVGALTPLGFNHYKGGRHLVADDFKNGTFRKWFIETPFGGNVWEYIERKLETVARLNNREDKTKMMDRAIYLNLKIRVLNVDLHDLSQELHELMNSMDPIQMQEYKTRTNI